jgi:hypothetical protein
MPKFRVSLTIEDWITVTVEADSEACAKRVVDGMTREELNAADEQSEGDRFIHDVEQLEEEKA